MLGRQHRKCMRHFFLSESSYAGLPTSIAIFGSMMFSLGGCLFRPSCMSGVSHAMSQAQFYWQPNLAWIIFARRCGGVGNYDRTAFDLQRAGPKALSRFHGRTALVTGASRGIGAAVAVLLAEAGCWHDRLTATWTNIPLIRPAPIAQWGPCRKIGAHIRQTRKSVHGPR